MEILSDIESLGKIRGDIHLTFGNFDGLHLGHRHFLSKTLQEANETNAKLVVVTFEPHPRELLFKADGFLINLPSERGELLSQAGVPFLLTLPFDIQMSQRSAEEFCGLFAQCKNIRKVIIGHDFAFGKDKGGDYNIISSYFNAHNIAVRMEEVFVHNEIAVSSSKIREIIKEGLVCEADELLGREFFLRGTVTRGKGRGKILGFPTANLSFSKRRILPCQGVYLTRTRIDGMTHPSLTNIGKNPTFKDIVDLSIETHILDFEGDLYNKTIDVLFCRHLRDEMNFPSREALMAQIRQDVLVAREYFSK